MIYKYVFYSQYVILFVQNKIIEYENIKKKES